MREINKIIIHHAGHPMKKTTVELIRSWHVERGFNNIGYHYLVDWKGEIYKGRQEREQGAHCKGPNQDSLGICAMGHFEIEEPTFEMMLSLQALTKSLSLRYSCPVLNHNQFSNTLCPGKNLLSALQAQAPKRRTVKHGVKRGL